MKNKMIACLAALLLLAGCDSGQEAAVPTLGETEAVPTTAPQGCYCPGSDPEQRTGGAVRLYTPDVPSPEGLAVLGNDILLFSGTGSGTRLTVLSGEELYCAASLETDVRIDPDSPSTQITPEGISYYDPVGRETVLLDENLREILRLSAPEGAAGEPILSGDRLTMFYMTGDSICALDLETRIPRTVRQFSGETGVLQGLILEDSVLVFRTAADTQFLSAQTGQLLEKWEGELDISAAGDHCQAFLAADGLPALIFGDRGENCRMLLTDGTGERISLPRSRAALEITGESPLSLDYYDLTTGQRASSLSLEGAHLSAAADGGDGLVWLLTGVELYRWDTRVLPAGDSRIYTDTYYTRSNPDLAGIARCQDLAEEISSRHGVEIRIWEDAVAVQPWDYHLTEEYLIPILSGQLKALDDRLAHFPEGMLSTLSDSFGGLTICLVRQLRGNGGSTLEDASGLQFWVEDHAYIALSTIHSTEGSLYHELCHVMDTRVFSHSNAYDQWEELNPSGFAYDYDYETNAKRIAGEYLRDAERCFIDTYSMSFPKEDRARILEYAMTEGNEHYFQSKTMQNKLRQLCIGLREAFGLKKSPEAFLWEQYLQEPLAYTK